MYHSPVLATESVDALAIKPEGTYVDATFGGGGHSRLIVDQLNENGRLFGFDQDQDALQNALEDKQFTFVQANFRHMARFLKLHQVEAVDGILADLGVSSHQLDEAARGFSFRFDAALDMRMNQHSDRTATTILNTYTAEHLQGILSAYGEVRNAKTLAQAIVQERQVKPFDTIGNFLTFIEPYIKGLKPRYLAQVFQALRIEVNDEMGALEDFFKAAFQVLRPGGRLVIIAYHSLEDRMAKNFFKTANIKGEVQRDYYGAIFRPFKILTKKAVLPSDAEIKRNPRSRSAKLRIAQRLDVTTEGFDWG